MEELTVKDLMVPLEEYATVSEEATLFEAVMALEAAQGKIDRTQHKYLHRAILVLDKGGNVVGKISQMDVLRALEPKYKELGDAVSISRVGFSPAFLKSMMEKQAFWDLPIRNVCTIAAERKVKEFMHALTEGEYIEETASLPVAIHMLVMGHHHSLLVTSGEKIVGILRLTDVFVAVFDLMKSCKY